MSVETNLSCHFGVVFENKLELSVCSLPSPIASQIQILTRFPYFSPPLHPPNVTCLSVNQTSHNFCDKCCDNSLPVSPVISSCHHTRYQIVTGLSRNHIVTSIQEAGQRQFFCSYIFKVPDIQGQQTQNPSITLI